MELVYIYDAFCSWCYGFSSILTPFMEKHPEYRVRVLSGGLILGREGTTAGDLPSLRRSAEKMASLYPVRYGAAYFALLDEGKARLNSTDAAKGYGVLRGLAEEKRHLPLMKAVQTAYYEEGKSLSDAQTYVDIAEKFHLGTEGLYQTVHALLNNGEDWHSDYTEAAPYGVEVFPTLLVKKGDAWVNVMAHTLRSEQALEQALAQA